MCDSDWTLAEERIQLIICGAALFAGLIACSCLYYLASYVNIWKVTTQLNKMIGTRILVHNSIIKHAVLEGEQHFYRFTKSREGNQMLEEFEKSNDSRNEQARKILSETQSFESNTGDIRSKLLALNPEELVIEEIRKPDYKGNFEVIHSSYHFDLPLVMFLIQAGQIIPVNFNGESIIIKTSDKIGQLYVKVLEILINSGEFNKEDGSNILQRLVEEYTPEADISVVRRIIYYCNNGPDGTVNRPNRRGETLLHHVKSVDLCRLLINNAANVDVMDNELRTPLHVAANR